MNKTKVLLAIGISVLLTLPIIGTIDYKNNKGDYKMATITSINNGDSAGSARSKINTNFTNVNVESMTNTSNIGVLSVLTTSAKTSLVAAINEVHTDAVSAFGGFYRVGPSAAISGSGTGVAKIALIANPYSLLNFTYVSNSSLRCDYTGFYLVQADLSVIGGDSNIFVFYINNTMQERGLMNSRSSVGTDYVHIGSSMIVQLVAGDILTLGIRNLDGENAIVYNYSLTAVKVG
jgi:hypothetical protein